MHETFFHIFKQKLKFPSNHKISLATDSEKAIVNAIQNQLSDSFKRLGCHNHLKKHIKEWIKKHLGTSDDIKVYIDHVKSLLDSDTQVELEEKFSNFKSIWSEPFLDYFEDCIWPKIHCYVKFEVEKTAVWNPYSGITTNISESANAMIKRLQEWKEAPVDSIMVSLKMLQVCI